MTTRAATFTSKIRNLKDYRFRIINNLTPQPTGIEIENTLKYFSQTLLSVLKDVPNIPAESYGPRQRDSVRLSVFPNLNYTGLFYAVLNMIDILPTMQVKLLEIGENMLKVLGCLVPFLEHDLLDSLPYTVASTLAIFPPTLHKDTIDLLCSNLLPMTLGFDGCFEPSYASESAAAIITTVLQHTDNGSFHSQILECFMSIKRDIIKDLLSIVAYGPPTARSPAANLLFYYWPQLNPSLSDRRGIHYKYTAWPPVLCQRRGCVNSGNCQAVKMCLNPALAIHSGDKPPPLYICSDCADDLRKDHSEYMTDILLPMSHVSTLCENKNCRSGENMAICTCFSIECASFNGNRPIRYCHHCHEQRHNTQRGQRHVYHLSIPEIWDCNMEMQRYLMDAIISLLKEAQPIESKRMLEMGEDHQHFNDDEELFLMEEAGERKLLSRYGIWLLVELCATKDDIPIEILGRLLGMLFQWFDATAYLPDDNVGSALERLKGEYIYDWLEEVAKTHFEVIVSCLLPHPVEYARVGGFWDTLCSRTTQIKEGLNCFFCLVPYDVITFEIWDYVMPYWLESIRTEVPTEDLHELKVLLNKSFDIDLCPLPFGMESEKMYHFISERFNDNSAYVQEQALQWLQILSTLDIYIPIHMLLSMFTYGVQNLTSLLHQQGDEPTTKQEGEETTHKPAFSPGTPVEECPPPLSPSKTHVVVEAYEIYDRETELVLPCYIMMLDLVLKQLELQNFPKYLGLYNETSKQIMQLLSLMLASEWDGTHVCGDDQQGNSCNFCQNIALWHQVTSQVMQNFCPLNQVKIPTKEIPRIDESKRLSATPKSRKNSGTSNDDAESTVEEKEEDASFDMTLMPLHLQLYHSFLLALEKTKDTDASFSLLMSMKYLILNGECLNYTVSQYPDYVKYSLSKLLIPNLWSLLQAKNSQQASVGVPLLLHCLTLPTGADVLWKLVEEDFSSENWKVRFAAVEKVTVFARLLEADSILHNQVIQTVLAHAFSLLVGSMEDINSSVSQQAIQYLETIRSVAIKGLCQCLEFQFDHVISDRIMILQRMHLLSNILPDLKILSWEFFLARFDALSLEAQLDLENSGDIAYLTDLTSSDRDSEHFLRKLNRARFALARTESIRSLSKGIKPPYRRAVSVPMHLISKTTPPKVEQLKEKSCIRQQSAPHFNLGRRMTSKMQFGAFGNIFPGSQIKEFTDEESNFTALLQKAMDMEGVDKDTVYQLVALLMKYMVTSNLHQGAKKDTKTQNIVLRHLNVLLGYNQTEKSFSVPPHKLRASAVFNAFLSGVPFVLDRNFELGNQILPITLLLLQYGPSPQRYASDYQPPNYTLWYLEPHTRISWLTTLLVIIYKYQFYTSPVSAIIQTLVRVVINTIDAQHHTCKKSHEDGFVPPSPSILRSKDSVKLNDLENIQETETPPQSPKVKDMVEVNLKSPTDGSTVQYIRNDKLGRISTIKEQSVDEIAETPRRPSRPSRKPRRLVEYTEPDHGKIDRDSSQKKQKESTKTDTEDVKSKSDRSPSPAKIETTPASESKSPDHGFNVDSIIAKQLHELSIKGDKSTGTHEPPLKGDKSAGLKYQSSSSTTTGTGSDISKITSPTLTKVTHMGSSITTDTSSTRTGITSTTDMSRDGTSEAESAAEDSEKTQTTSDADSEKQTGATDSGDADTQEEGKGGDTIQKSGRSHGMKPNFRQRKARKTGLTTIELQKIFPELNETVQEENGGRLTGKRARKSELLTKSKATKKPFSCRYGDNVMVERCPECSAILEQYDEDTIGYCVIVLATFIHREPSLATPLLLETLQCVSRIASSSPYVWQTDSNMMIPGNSISIARQFLRCVLHQLSPNGIFPMLFQSSFKDVNFFKTMAVALVDFPELTCHAPIQFLLEGLNGKKNLPSENIMLLLNNLATYMNCISLETSAPMWSSIIGNFDIFLRKLAAVLPNPCDTTSLLKIMTAILKVTGISASRSILEPFSKLMSFIIQNCSFKLQQVLDICSLCNRVFSKERDKLYLTRTVIFELVQAIKFKNGLPDENFLLLVQFVVLDSGGTIGSTNIVSDVMLLYNNQSQILLSTCAAECMRDHLHECTEFVADLHTLTKIKNNMKGGGSNSLNEDTLGNQLKSGIAQFVALEITRGNGRDNRGISRYLPWLYHPPSTVQQGPKEFTDCIGHIRLLSWLLIGSLTHTAMTEGTAPITCQPIPLDATSYISEHVLVIMTGFDERSKDSVLHMSSLFHAFILCQLWTMYCESAAAQFPVYSENHKAASNMVMDFWGRVTPGILQMLNTPKELAEMVNLHFLSLMEALRECNSTVLAKLFPMWTSILFTHHSQLPGHLQVRLQTVENWEPPSSSKDQASFNAAVLLSWLKRIQFKLGQIEVQSSAATQFYTV